MSTESRLIDGLRTLVTTSLDAGTVTIQQIADELGLAAPYAQAIVSNPEWDLTMAIDLVGRLGLEFEIVAAPSVAPALTSVPSPLKVKQLAESHPPLTATPPSPEAASIWVEPGERHPETGKVFVRLTHHAKERIDEMGLTRAHIIEAMQPEYRTLTRTSYDGKMLVESSFAPDIVICVVTNEPYVVASVLPKTYETYERAS